MQVNKPERLTAEQFKRVQRDLKMSIPQIADALGVSAPVVSKWRAGAYEIPLIVSRAVRDLQVELRGDHAAN